MSATSRLKQLLFMVAALALVSLGLVAALSTASPARAAEGDCIPTQDTLSAWANSGDPFTLHDATPPSDPDGTDEASTTNLVKFVLVGTTKHVTQEAVAGTPGTASQWWNFSPDDNRGPFEGPPAFPTDPRGTWQGPHTEGGPSQDLTGTFQQGSGNAPWFHREAGTEGTPGQEEVSHTDYTWQKQTRTFTEGNDCPDPGPDCEQNPTAEGCPPVDNGKKIVVCKYTGTPPGGLSHIIVVSENTLNNVLDDEGNPFTGSFPFEWTDAQGQAGGSIAIRFAVGNEQPTDLGICPQPPVECPEGDHNGQEPGCDEPPVECPDGDHNGQEPGCGEPDPGPDCEEDPTQEHCEEDDKDCEEDPTQEHCEEDDKDCEEDPNQDKCDEDNNPPVVVPDDGTTPNNSPSNGPTVRGASATAPSAAPGTTVAGTPAAQVPTAVNAGLAPQELAGDGGTLGLLGIATALLGAALVGLTFRPKRRIGAALRART
jgi:hypothetical protein